MATTTEKTSANDASRIVDQLQGLPADKSRRAELLEGMFTALAGGADAVTEELSSRFESLEIAFSNNVDELKKKL